MDWFHSEQACLDYLERLRWPKDFICPSCGVFGVPIKTSRNRLICQSCKHQTSVTAGTIFDKNQDTPQSVAGGRLVHHQSEAWGERVSLREPKRNDRDCAERAERRETD